MTYATLTQVHQELNLSTSVTTNDTELDALLTIIDNQINTKLQRYTSLPIQVEMQTYLADVEARWVVTRFRLRRATPQEQQQYQALLANIDQEWQDYLANNFQTSFFGEGSQSDNDSIKLDLGQWNETDRSGSY